MQVLQLQFGDSFQCAHFTGHEANEMQRNMCDPLAVYTDHPRGQDVSKIMILFEYLGDELYGFGIFYDPNLSGRVSERCECLLFAVNNNSNSRAAKEAAEDYLAEKVCDLALQSMPIAKDVCRVDSNKKTP